MHGETVKFI